MKPPILFLIFNRPDTTQLVFNEIRRYKPIKLYVAADGHRKDKVGERELCEKARKIIKKIDWECEIKTLFRKNNLGCKKAVSSAIDWFFNNEKEGIILEDDCLPNQSFFQFCEELLKKYRNDERVTMISGDNFQFGWKNRSESYYFSKYCHIWGWATWKRAWEQYDVKIKTFPDFIKNRQIKKIFSNKNVQNYWIDTMNSVYIGEIDTWDYQWVYSVWLQNGLCILPNVNLISNIGCDAGTHMGKSDKKSKVSNMPAKNISFPLVHPKKIEQNIQADERYSDNFIKVNKLIKTLVKINKYIEKIVSEGR